MHRYIIIVQEARAWGEPIGPLQADAVFANSYDADRDYNAIKFANCGKMVFMFSCYKGQKWKLEKAKYQPTESAEKFYADLMFTPDMLDVMHQDRASLSMR